MGETFSVNTGADEDDICYELDNVFIEVHDVDATLAVRPYVDVVVTMPASPDLVNMSSDHLDIFHVFPSCSLPYPPPRCHNISYVDFHDMLKGECLTVWSP